MPGMDGLELAQAMHRFESEHGFPRMPIIALTADVQTETRLRCFSTRSNAVLHKPASRAFDPGCPWRGPRIAARVSRVHVRQSNVRAHLRGNAALLADLTAIFRQESAVQRAAAQEAIEQANDCQGLRLAVHRLRGQVMVFDATQLSDLLAKIEEQALAKDLRHCQTYWNDAVRQLEAFHEELRARA